jgi:hypothetical protein
MEERKWGLGDKEQSKKAAEVGGSNPTRSIIINIVKYGIKSSLFLIIVGQVQQQWH